ncbi:MAG: DNA repair protein RecO [Bacteroidota bacterium]|jgi:DNA repair protein RecO (recombination protein O)|nr:DNA repair protein RecO [Ignavibacteria bacterium]HEX2961853.1 DNA repair protein RecO [Ignavibacteriales bacterium]MCU7500907.1 DNA repair protein RecO [Ignavibacteria bacterium]MCU7511906.1 DNA repair protein RecO [Ignavibacteria bacterium]MCU7522475.1 DNA repair protein RecO [Ignavibacteria bacterium]
MSEIIKTEAVVLSKMNYRESSTIATFYTKDLGKISGIIKGARQPKSPVGHKIDSFNHLQIVLYKKAGREIQLISQAELISYYPRIKEDLLKLKYASASLELVLAMTIEEEANERLFRGLVRILNLFETSNRRPGVLLIKFIVFLLKESGFEIQFERCSICGRPIGAEEKKYYFNFERGMICSSCSHEVAGSMQLSPELFQFITGLSNIGSEEKISAGEIDNTLNFLEKYLKYHVPEFKGIKSIHLF